ncbi:hypothetical protein GUITHDRAFT_90537 [Guillardia theta CCMP2712]|uniref:non-specific serine/threonine protein kinase n=1 Tax=Guillardia theta (strain CCMP2712) TaxID=905079 RepID=L1IDI4_GUITC|nr:hypothetical protein GUITHDRAFT_90537 [Guillardia theta CCMP2712]EKX34273.1 hypothetical protein GUITHDRAFT_90537 [Guillardia theta CCMP2712]|eukprot:XP_005821253.1 hypothetical protein GUITHDRAFT_90537 [Guillardia theta CCMP2712]
MRCRSEEPLRRESPQILEGDEPRAAARASRPAAVQSKPESNAHSSVNDVPPSSGSNSLPSDSLNVGYYARFFHQVRRIGTGAYGSVFECRHVMDGVHLGTYAVKVAPVGDNRQWLHKVLREVRNLQFLSHNNVVRYMHSWLEPHQSSPFTPMVPCLFILMEYANSGNLHSLLALDLPQRKRGFLSEEQIFLYTMDICSGLQYLHSMDIVHRDLKPENILVQSGRQSDSGIDIGHRLMISDLGQSQRLSENRGASRRSGCTGTVRYTAPEMLEVSVAFSLHYLYDWSTKADVWSLGAIVFCLCYSAIPYQEIEDLQELARCVVSGPSMPRPSTPVRSPPLVELLDLTLDKDPSKRPEVSTILSSPIIQDYISRSQVPHNSPHGSSSQREGATVVRVPSERDLQSSARWSSPAVGLLPQETGTSLVLRRNAREHGIDEVREVGSDLPRPHLPAITFGEVEETNGGILSSLGRSLWGGERGSISQFLLLRTRSVMGFIGLRSLWTLVLKKVVRLGQIADRCLQESDTV